MADLDKYLRRFRRLVSPPGRPGPAAVPSDRAEERSDELQEVFAAIDRIEGEAREILDDGEERSEAMLADAEEEARRLLSEAGERADEARAEEQARHRRSVEEDSRSALEEARDEVREIERRVDTNLQSVADRVLERILGTGGEGPG